MAYIVKCKVAGTADYLVNGARRCTLTGLPIMWSYAKEQAQRFSTALDAVRTMLAAKGAAIYGKDFEIEEVAK